MARSWHRREPPPFAGRLEMIMLHMVLVLQHLERGAASLRTLGHGLFDAFCRDLDGNGREIGVGDLAVPRTMRRIGEAFYGRQAAYDAALDALEDERLAAALQRNMFAGGTPPGVGFGLPSTCAKACALERAQLVFPDPEQVLLQARQTG